MGELLLVISVSHLVVGEEEQGRMGELLLVAVEKVVVVVGVMAARYTSLYI